MKFHGFTSKQRKDLVSVWPEKQRAKKITSINAFIDDLEWQIAGEMDLPRLTRKSAKAEFEEIAKHAKGLRLALERLGGHERWKMTALSGAALSRWGLPPMDADSEAKIANLSLPLLQNLSQIVEGIAEELSAESKSRGPDKSLEKSILFSIAFLYKRHGLGTVSTSDSSVFVGLMKAVGIQINREFGVDLLRSVLASEAAFFTPHFISKDRSSEDGRKGGGLTGK